MNALRDLLYPRDTRDFFKHDWTTKSTVIEGFPERWTPLLDEKTFCTLVADLLVQGPDRIGLYTGGKSKGDLVSRLAEDVARELPVNIAHLAQLCPGGSTLYVRQISELFPPLDTFAFALFNELEERVHINAYLSPPGGQSGLGGHYDPWDIFVIQLCGAKEWILYEGGQMFPVAKCSFKNVVPYSTSERFVLNAGSVLYLPRGKWHRVLPTDRASLHLTIGIHCKTGLTFIDWLASELERECGVRKNLPISISEQEDCRTNWLSKVISIAQNVLRDRSYAERFYFASFQDEYIEMTKHIRQGSASESRLGSLEATDDLFLHWQRKTSVRVVAETALVIMGTDRVTLNRSGLLIFQEFREGSTVRLVAERIAQRCSVDPDAVLADVRSIVGPLLRCGILTASFS